MKYFVLHIIILCLSIVSQAQKVTIVAAADLRFALDAVVKQFKLKHPQADIHVIYGSSGNAYTQITNGAPYDLYFSADILYPKKLYEAKLTLTSPTLYGIGRIVLWSKTYDISKGIPSLRTYPKARIAIAQPDHAPYGKRAVESMKYYGVYDNVKSQILYGENISQATQFCVTGNADIGILALSLVLSPTMTNKGNYVIIDEKSHAPLEQAFVVLQHAKGNTVAFAFADFVSSNEARSILEKYGFVIPK